MLCSPLARLAPVQSSPEHILTPTGAKYVGGSGSEDIRGIVAAADGTMWVVGCTNSADLAVTGDAAQRRRGGGWDGFIARVT